MLLIDIAKKELAGGHIASMLFIELTKLELTGHIGIFLFIEIAKLKLTGGHIETMLFIEMEKIKFSGAILELCYL